MRPRTTRRHAVLAAITAVAVATTSAVTTTASASQELPPQTQIIGDFWKGVRPMLDVPADDDDPSFYQAPSNVDLDTAEPGTVLRERSTKLHVATIELPVTVTQILYVTTNALGHKEANVTSVIHPPYGSDGNVVSYQSFYDSSNTDDNPSRIIAGNFTLGGAITAVETPLIAPALLAGHPVVFSDTEGANADFAAGPGYGRATLDSLRAAIASTTAPVTKTDDIGLLGYSGGAIASNWAAIQLDSYAPDLSDNIVGVAQGGLFVNPVSNLEYAGSGLLWAGVVAMALASLKNSYDLPIEHYFTDYGNSVLDDASNLSIIEAVARYPEVRWSDLAKPEYPRPQDVPEVAQVLEEINMGNWPAPSTPMFLFQGAGGFLEGTPVHPGRGPGDGVMVTKDVRTLMRDYCEAGTSVEYREYPYASHVLAAVPWLIEGSLWLEGRFNGAPASDNCSTIPAGNPL